MEVLLIKICKIQPLDLLFLVIFISFYINRYHFSQIFKTSFSIIWKKDFCHKFSFFNGVTQLPPPRHHHHHPHPHPLKQPKPTKREKTFLLMLPNEGGFVQHRKSISHHLFISYLRNLYIIIYKYINYLYIIPETRYQKYFPRKFRLTISCSRNYLLISRVLLTLCTYVLLLYHFKYIPST